MEKSALIAMSGGVDSSVAALLMLREGYTCAGGTMLLHGGAEGDIGDAASVCARLGMEHHVFDLSREFDELVIKRFVAAYEAGLTPNPCVLCNRTLKFPMMLAAARALGLDSIATGHYAKSATPPPGGIFSKGQITPIRIRPTYSILSVRTFWRTPSFPSALLKRARCGLLLRARGL